MGNNPKSLIKQPHVSVYKPQQQQYSQNNIQCTSCNKNFIAGTPMNEIQTHVKLCLQIEQSNFNINQLIIEKKPSLPTQNQYIYQKIPVDYTHTKYKWQKVKQDNKSVNANITPQEASKLPFQLKLKWFRQNLQKLRIPWQNGADYLKIDRSNLLVSSYIEAQKVNMHKEIKIDFVDQKINDAGGLLRQWIHMIIKQMFDYSAGLFSIANTEQIMYKLNWDEDLDQQFSKQLFTLFGIVIGKAIFEKIPILCYLDRTILKQLCSQKPQLNDVYGYDSQLYTSWSYIFQNSVQGLDLSFMITKEKQDNTIKQIQLIQHGSQIAVDDQNKSMYINTSIQFYCTKAVSRSITAIKNSLNKIVPLKLLSAFQPFELEMMLNGVPFIDVQDWQTHTDYKGVYNSQHHVIKWFWNKVYQFDQEKLAQLLHFTTGSSRAPIQGFKKLESNRGNHSRFIIESTPYSKINPYPKGHTCFNRLQLPIYPSQQLLQIYLIAVVNNDLDGVFGLD